MVKKTENTVPAFPRALHLPYKPNTHGGSIATEAEAAIIFEQPILVEEKVDGASVGIHFDGKEELVVRNKNHILNKGHVRRTKDTPARMQFRPMWNWIYDNREKFRALADSIPGVSVYGEWMWAQHGMRYDRLPDWLFAYDLYRPEYGKFVQSELARDLLTQAGFSVPRELHRGHLSSYEALEWFANQMTPYSSEGALNEGVYVRVCDDAQVIHRFKMVRQGFVQGALWDDNELKKNRLAK